MSSILELLKVKTEQVSASRQKIKVIEDILKGYRYDIDNKEDRKRLITNLFTCLKNRTMPILNVRPACPHCNEYVFEESTSTGVCIECGGNLLDFCAQEEPYTSRDDLYKTEYKLTQQMSTNVSPYTSLVKKVIEGHDTENVVDINVVYSLRNKFEMTQYLLDVIIPSILLNEKRLDEHYSRYGKSDVFLSGKMEEIIKAMQETTRKKNFNNIAKNIVHSKNLEMNINEFINCQTPELKNFFMQKLQDVRSTYGTYKHGTYLFSKEYLFVLDLYFSKLSGEKGAVLNRIKSVYGSVPAQDISKARSELTCYFADLEKVISSKR